jgi:rRNA-processing protein FCF1
MTPLKPIRVLLDTNFLMLTLRFGVDIQSELECILEAAFVLSTTPAVVEELEQLKTKVKQNEVKIIEFAIIFASRVLKIDDKLKPQEKVDDQLLRLAEKNEFIVATTDTELRRRLRKEGLPVIFLRQRRYLAIDGIIA